MLKVFLEGCSIVFQPLAFFYLFLGTVAGLIFGALPGINAAMAIALMIQFTYRMSPQVAIAFMVSVYCSAITGGGITAVLFKIPGTPSNAPTTFDGYPLARAGKVNEVLGVSLVCSAIGGLASALAMFFLTPQLSTLGLKFGPSELFAVSFFGLSVLGCLDSKNVLKTVISGLLGLFLATIGFDPIMGTKRLTFGTKLLRGGFEMIPVMIGMFAITEVLKQTVKPVKIGESVAGNEKVKVKFIRFSELWSMKMTALRSAILGTLIGILPGAGTTIASFISYTTEVKLSKTPENYGKGEMKGVVASEVANNAATGGSMVPLLALGIPGGNAAAIMMSALVLQGVQFGPMLLQTHSDYLASVYLSMIVTNILMVFIAVYIARVFSKIMKVPYSILGSVIAVLAVIGSFALQNNIDDVFIMACAGLVGYAFNRYHYSSAALVLGLVLGSLCESNLRRAITIASGNIWVVLTKPITAVLLLACLGLLLFPAIKGLVKKTSSSVE